VSFIDLAREAQRHREVYIAVLQGALRTPGDKRRLAAQVGITPQYLSYLLDPHDRTPSPVVAEKIAQALPIDPEQRRALMEHMLLASERRMQLRKVCCSDLPGRPVDEYLEELRQAHHEAGYTRDPKQAKDQYRAVSEASRELLKQLNPAAYPLDVVEVCFLLHDVESVLNRHSDALYHAKLARDTLDNLDEADYDRDREGFDRYQINAIRAEAVAYHNLKLAHQAYDSCREAETTKAMRYRSEFWKPHLYR
jgi:transcriptional regulator with XRE-family HTH domain